MNPRIKRVIDDMLKAEKNLEHIAENQAQDLSKETRRKIVLSFFLLRRISDLTFCNQNMYFRPSYYLQERIMANRSISSYWIKEIPGLEDTASAIDHKLEKLKREGRLPTGAEVKKITEEEIGSDWDRIESSLPDDEEAEYDLIEELIGLGEYTYASYNQERPPFLSNNYRDLLDLPHVDQDFYLQCFTNEKSTEYQVLKNFLEHDNEYSFLGIPNSIFNDQYRELYIGYDSIDVNFFREILYLSEYSPFAYGPVDNQKIFDWDYFIGNFKNWDGQIPFPNCGLTTDIFKNPALVNFVNETTRWLTTSNQQFFDHLRVHGQQWFDFFDSKSLWLWRDEISCDEFDQILYYLHEEFHKEEPRVQRLKDNESKNLDKRYIAEQMVKFLSPKIHESIFDPCSGSGNNLIEAVKYCSALPNYQNINATLSIRGCSDDPDLRAFSKVRIALIDEEGINIKTNIQEYAPDLYRKKEESYSTSNKNPNLILCYPNDFQKRSSIDYLGESLNAAGERGRIAIVCSNQFLEQGRTPGSHNKYFLEIINNDWLDSVIGLTPRFSLVIIDKAKHNKRINKVLFVRELNPNTINIFKHDAPQSNDEIDVNLEVIGLHELNLLPSTYLAAAREEKEKHLENRTGVRLKQICNICSGRGVRPFNSANEKYNPRISKKEGIPFIQHHDLNNDLTEKYLKTDLVEQFLSFSEIEDDSSRICIDEQSLLVSCDKNTNLNPTIFDPRSAFEQKEIFIEDILDPLKDSNRTSFELGTLIESIRANELQNPIQVILDASKGKFRVEDGARRVLAYQHLKNEEAENKVANPRKWEKILAYVAVPKITLGNRVCQLIPKEDVSIDYIAHALNSDLVKKQLEDLLNANESRLIQIRQLENIVIYYPSRLEQDNFIKNETSRLLKLRSQRKDVELERRQVNEHNLNNIQRINDRVSSLKHTLNNQLPIVIQAIESVLKRGKEKLKFDSELVEDALEGDDNKPLTITEKLNTALNVIKGTSESIHNLDYIGRKNDDLENIESLFEEIKNENSKYSFDIKYVVSNDAKFILIDRVTFKISINEFISNANKYAFKEKHTNNAINFTVIKAGEQFIVDYWNNGIPFPKDIDEKKYLSPGDQNITSGGGKWGGYAVNNFLETCNGKFKIVRETYPTHFRITIPNQEVKYESVVSEIDPGRRDWKDIAKAKYLFDKFYLENCTMEGLAELTGWQVEEIRRYIDLIKNSNEITVLSVSAAETHHLIKQYRIHSCPDSYTYENTGYITFRIPPKGQMNAIYKIKNTFVIPLDKMKFYRNNLAELSDHLKDENNGLESKEIQNLCSYINHNPFKDNNRFYFLSEEIILPYAIRPEKYSVNTEYYSFRKLFRKDLEQ